MRNSLEILDLFESFYRKENNHTRVGYGRDIRSQGIIRTTYKFEREKGEGCREERKEQEGNAAGRCSSLGNSNKGGFIITKS